METVLARRALALLAGKASGHPALRAGDHQVLDPHVGKGPARHHPVVAAARAVAVEILDRHAALDQVLARRRSLLDAAGRRDVIGRHAVAKDAQRARAFDLADLAGLQPNSWKKGGSWI